MAIYLIKEVTILKTCSNNPDKTCDKVVPTVPLTFLFLSSSTTL